MTAIFFVAPEFQKHYLVSSIPRVGEFVLFKQKTYIVTLVFHDMDANKIYVCLELQSGMAEEP